MDMAIELDYWITFLRLLLRCRSVTELSYFFAVRTLKRVLLCVLVEAVYRRQHSKKQHLVWV